jgi:glycosyltransferase involved in cell wall biosynthesis
MKSNYLFYFCDGIGSVFDSQVLALIKSISKKKYFKKIYLFIGIRNENQNNDFLENRAIPEIEIVFFKTYPNYPFFNFMNRKSIKTALLKLNVEFEKVIFHVRGEIIARQLSRILNKNYHNKILPDVRGASIEEISEYYDSNKYFKKLKILNSKNAVKNLTRFEKISVVSNSLKEYLITNYNINADKLFVTPCLAGTNFRFDELQRDRIRKALNLSNDDLLIVFSSGGTANWQNSDILIKLAEKGLIVLNLSKKVINHKNIINKFISYSEMPYYLNAADVAIIWRENSIVNKVASPVKFSEYICCGLPVISNDTVDMTKEYIKKNSCGLVINSLDDIDIDSLNHLKQIDRKIISETGLSDFGIDKINDQYSQIYSAINE